MIGIIGMGWVGASVAISILQRGICRELLVNDLRMDIAEGEAMDLNHGSSFFPACHVRAARIEEMVNCDAVVVTAGRGGSPGESRLDLLKDNLNIAKAISSQLKGFTGLLIIVANPVDVLTYYYQQFTGLPLHRVIGTGTMLDTARLRELIGKKIQVNPNSVHAHVVGEHGDSEVVAWSRAMVGGISLRKWPKWSIAYEEEIAEEVRTAAYQIIQRKGATNHAIGLVTATLLKWLLRGEQRLVTVSSILHGPFGFSDVALSLPTLFNEKGIKEVMALELDPTELAALIQSGETIKNAIDSVR